METMKSLIAQAIGAGFFLAVMAVIGGAMYTWETMSTVSASENTAIRVGIADANDATELYAWGRGIPIEGQMWLTVGTEPKPENLTELISKGTPSTQK